MDTSHARTLHKLIGVFLLLTTVSFSMKLHAHALEQGYLFLTVNADSIEGRIEMNIPDVNTALGLDLSTARDVTGSEIAVYADQIKAYMQERIAIKQGNGMLLQELSLVKLPLAQYVSVGFRIDQLTALPSQLDFEYNILFDKAPDHRGFVILENDWRSGTFNQESNIVLVFTPEERQKRLDLTQSNVSQGFIQMVKLGVEHIWEGIDHILFLLALLLPSVVQRREGRWQVRDDFSPSLIYVVKIVTVFTIAHSVTLSLATLEWVTLPSRLVETVIAISIAIAALDILYPVFRGRIWLIVFAFGLFHGFGFASILQALNIPDSYMALSLLGFNLGVELGQVAIVCVVFPLLYLFRHFALYNRILLKYGATCLIVVSLYWFIERGFMVDLPAGAMVNWLLDSVAMNN